MAAPVTRNSFKGYTYQHFVYCYFMSLMDTERRLIEINAEVDEGQQFDDIMVADEAKKYYIQAKNYPGTTFEDIVIEDDVITVKNNKSKCIKGETGIVIINTTIDFPVNSEIFGLSAYQSNNFYIIALSSDKIQELIISMFQTVHRAEAIIFFSYNRCINAKFYTSINDLPEIRLYKTKLEEETVYVRNCIKSIENGILAIIGKPGVGKSHFAEEIYNCFPEAVIYRFWISSQDTNIASRRDFDNFICDLALKIYKSPRSFSKEQLIYDINANAPIIIIDGLDHIENYNPSQFQQFIEFIDSISSARVLVLTRPLKRGIEWPYITLGNWSRDETIVYLQQTHSLKYKICNEIYSISDGYPIIVNFLARHYSLNGSIDGYEPVSDLDEYYNTLMGSVDTKRILGIFLLTTSFYTDNEISYLVGQPYGGIVEEYIAKYPYLFERNVNRISLIHDSLNSYLQRTIDLPKELNDCIIEKVKSSICNKDIEYLARIADFNLDKDFISEILCIYASFDSFQYLLKTYPDFESVKEFYLILKSLLENHENVLDINQYYSFILITQIIERNDFVGYEGLLFNHIQYLINYNFDENSIFSSGLLWASYRYIKYGDQEAYRRPFYRYYYDIDRQISEFDEVKVKEENHFNILSAKIDSKEVLKQISELLSDIDKRDILARFAAYQYINKSDEFGLYSAIKGYISHSNDAYYEKIIEDFFAKYLKEKFFIKSCSGLIVYILKTLGVLRQENILLNYSLKQLILEKAQDGSFDAYNHIVDFIRLAIHEQRQIDIENLWMYYYMYYSRKDYSVVELPQALFSFEKHGLIGEEDSLRIIDNVMNQSEKGIKHILCEYINIKDDDFMKRCLVHGVFDGSYSVDIYDLIPEKIELLPERLIIDRLFEMLRYHQYGKSIEYNELKYVLKTSYRHFILKEIKRFEYKIISVPKTESFNLNGVDILVDQEASEKQSSPFIYGHIHEEDIPFIKSHKLLPIEIARYTDGWYSCFPLVNAYEHFDKEELRSELLSIIHTSLFARIPSIERTGNWILYLGNLPKFLDQIEFDASWDALFTSFIEFLHLSMISFENK